MSDHDFDVLVVGGGLTGLAFALLLQAQAHAGHEPTIAIVEAGAPPGESPAGAIGLPVVALSPASRTILDRCGAWAGLPGQRVGPYRRMVVWQADGEPRGRASIVFDAAEEGAAELGYIVENDLVRRELWRRATAIPSIRVFAGVSPAAVGTGATHVSVRLADGRELRGRLVVGADGHSSWLRDALRVPVTGHGYGQHAVVANVASGKAHGETAWQRFLADGPLALLPLADGRCSIVWSCEEGRARSVVAATEGEFNRALTEASAAVLGDLRVTTPRLSFPLAASRATRYTGLRFALIGDAAHRVHPLAGQGVNLGFLDAAALAEVLVDHMAAARGDPGDPLALRRYERWRKGANLAALGAMDALHKLFTGVPGVARAAGLGLSVVDRLAPVKSRLADYAMGRRGDLPRVVGSARMT